MYLEDVGDKLLDVLLQDLLKHREQDFLKVFHGRGLGVAHNSDAQAERFKQVVVVVRSCGVPGRGLKFLGKNVQQLGQVGDDIFLKKMNQ